ncbi:MAG: hypothetical protein IPL90_11315 [Holophagales bacterium]|nr:hypothetical protein [Holophagales bacterium]
MKKSLATPLIVAMLAIPAGALAQTDAERIADLEKRVESLVKKDKARTADEEKAKAAKGTTLRASTDKGKLEWTSADGANSFRLAGRLQLDGVTFSGNENRLASAVAIRRVRLGYKVRIAKDWVSEFDVDFAENAVDIKDAYIGYQGFKNSEIQAGHFKVPFGMDTLTSSKDIWFVERAYVDSWGPDRRFGLAYSYGGDRFSAKADLFAQTIAVDATGIDQGWGWAARGTFAPVMVSETRAIHVGAATNWRRPDAGSTNFGVPQVYEVDFSSRPECTKASKAKFLNSPKFAQTEWVQQYAGELAGVWDAFAWQAEYQTTSVTRRDGNPTLEDHDFDGWYGQVSYVINGKRKYAASEGLVDKVSPGKGGAYEILARYSTLDLNDLTATDAAKGGSAKNFTLGANWYPNTSFRVMLNWTHVNNDEYAKPKSAYGGKVNDDFDEYQVRLQFAF